MANGSKFRLQDVSIFLEGDHLHLMGSGEEEALVSLYDLADQLFNQPLDVPHLVPRVILGLHNVIDYIEEKSEQKKVLQ